MLFRRRLLSLVIPAHRHSTLRSRLHLRRRRSARCSSRVSSLFFFGRSLVVLADQEGQSLVLVLLRVAHARLIRVLSCVPVLFRFCLFVPLLLRLLLLELCFFFLPRDIGRRRGTSSLRVWCFLIEGGVLYGLVPCRLLRLNLVPLRVVRCVTLVLRTTRCRTLASLFPALAFLLDSALTLTTFDCRRGSFFLVLDERRDLSLDRRRSCHRFCG